MPLAEARVSPLDRAFLFGDAVYEVIPVYGARAFKLREHLDRLERSLAQIHMAPPLSQSQWGGVCRQLIDANGADDASLYLQVTRGAELDRNHAWPERLKPTLFAFASPLANVLEREPAGISAMTAQDLRWKRCDIKSTSLLANVLLRKSAVDSGNFESILLDDGWLREGSSSAVHAVFGDAVCSPPLEPAILPGITRVVVQDLAASLGLRVKEQPVSEAQLRAADEIWISLSTRGLLAVTTLDGRPVGHCAPGPVFKRLRNAFVDYVERAAGTPEL